MAVKKDNKKGKGFFQKLFKNVTENVGEGANLVGEKVAEVGEKVAETSAKAYVAGSELVTETSDKIHDFTERQALQKEENKVVERQNELKFEFGQLTLDHYLKNDSLRRTFLTTKAVEAIVEEFQANKKRMKSIAKAIKKLETNK